MSLCTSLSIGTEDLLTSASSTVLHEVNTVVHLGDSGVDAVGEASLVENYVFDSWTIAIASLCRVTPIV